MSQFDDAVFRFFAWSHVVIAGLVAYVGGLLLHGWTTYLFFENWGFAWAFMAFFSPLFGELVAVVACFWWGVWFYVLAAAAYIAGISSFSFVDEASELMASKLGKRLFGASAIMMYILLGCFGFFAIRAATLPKLLSENDRREIEDVSDAVCGVLKNCLSSDSAALRLKRRQMNRAPPYWEIRRHAKRRGQSQSEGLPRAFALTERDSMAYVFGPEGFGAAFFPEAESAEAVESLPERCGQPIPRLKSKPRSCSTNYQCHRRKGQSGRLRQSVKARTAARMATDA